jgi:tetratricopeptide (TPR) repeat protein
MATPTKRFIAGIIAALCLTSTLLWAKPGESTPFQSAMEQIVNGFTAHNTKPFDQAVDADAILDTTFSDILLSTEWERGFRSGLKKAITTQLGEKLIGQMPAGTYAKLLRIKVDGNKAKALIRLDFGDNGNAYMDMHLVNNKKGKIRIVDWYDYSRGQLYTESLQQITATLSPTPTVLGKIFDIASNRKANMDLVFKLIKMNKEGKHKEVATEFLTLDESLRKSRLLSITAVQAANQSGDMDLYKKTLSNLEHYFNNDPGMAFLLLDYYFLEGRYEKVLATIDQLQKSFGVKDAALIAIKSNTMFSQEKYQEAEKLASQAIALEPEYENAYWTLLNSQLPQKKFHEAVLTAKTLEEKFGYDMGPESLAKSETLSELTKSPEYRKWKNGK